MIVNFLKKIINSIINLIHFIKLLFFSENKNIKYLMFFSFFSFNKNENNLSLYINIASITIVITSVFVWYKKDSIINFWKNWWNKNKENVNTNSTSVNKSTKEEGIVDETSNVSNIKSDSTSSSLSIVEEKNIVKETSNVLEGTLPNWKSSNTIDFQKTDATSEVSAAPIEEEFLQYLSKKKWYDYTCDKINIVDENTNILGTLEKYEIFSQLIDCISISVTKVINLKNTDSVQRLSLANNTFLEIKKNFLEQQHNNDFSIIKENFNKFIENNRANKYKLYVELEENVIDLDPIESYEEVLDKTIESIVKFVDNTKIGLYEQTLSESLDYLYTRNYRGILDYKTVKGFPNDKHKLVIGNNWSRDELNYFLNTKSKITQFVSDQLGFIEKFASTRMDFSYDYYFEAYYKNLNLFLSDDAKKNLFETLKVSDRCHEIINIFNETMPLLLQEKDPSILLVAFRKRDNTLDLNSLCKIDVRKISSDNIKDTILIDLYKLKSDENVQEQLETLLSEEKLSKINEINETFSLYYPLYSIYIDTLKVIVENFENIF
jgi:hypothetical protein